MKMERIVDSHFHIWNFPMRASFHKTDASFDWPDASLPKIHRDILVQHCTALLLHCTALYYNALKSTLLQCTALRSTIFHCTALYCLYQAPEAEVEMQKSGVEAAVFVQCLNRWALSPPDLATFYCSSSLACMILFL